MEKWELERKTHEKHSDLQQVCLYIHLSSEYTIFNYIVQYILCVCVCVCVYRLYALNLYSMSAYSMYVHTYVL